MPKLNKAAAERVGEAETSDFSALPEGTYRSRLDEVEVREGKSSGAPYWSWAFTVTEEGDQSGRKLWVNTSLSEKADWKMKEVFDAFGYSTDSDTDEMIGEEVRLVVTQRVIEQGARAGQMGNNVDLVLSLEGGTSTTKAAGDDPDEDDVF